MLKHISLAKSYSPPPPEPNPAPASIRDFDEFYAASFKRLVGQLYTVTGNLTDAEDLTQDSFVAAARNWNAISEYDNVEAWVRRVAINRALNLRRRAQRKTKALQRMAAGLRHAPAADAGNHELSEALRGIPIRYRTVLTLHYLVDLPVSEIALELGLPESTVKTRLVRGRQRLRNHFAPSESA